MKRASVVILLLLCFGLVKAQMPDIYTDLHILPSKYQQYKNYSEYELDSFYFYIGKGKESLYLYMINKMSGAQVFNIDERELGARRHEPRFFGKEGDQSTMIITVSLVGDYSWGSHILIIEGNKVYNAGFIQYSADNFNFSSIGLYAQFEKVGDNFIMFFQEDVQLINYATEEIISGADLEFLVSKTKVIRTK